MSESVVVLGINDINEKNRIECFSSESKAELLDRIWAETSEQMCLAQMIYDADGSPVDYYILDINPAFENTWGMTREHAAGKKVTELFPYSYPQWIAKCGEAVRTGSPLSTVEHIDEPEIWNDIRVYPLNFDHKFIQLSRNITVNKQNESSLQRAQEKAEQDRKLMQTILETIPSAVVIVEANQRLSYINPRGLELYGIDYVGCDLEAHVAGIQALTPEGKPYLLEDMPVSHSLLLGETVRECEMLIHRPDGSRIPLLVSSAPIFDANGHIISAVVVFDDITEQKRVEEVLRQSERLYRTIFENSQDGFVLTEIIYGQDGIPVDHIIHQVNRGFESHTGYQAEDIVGRKASELISHIDPKWYQNHDTVVKTGRPIHIESYYLELGRWYDVNIFPYSDNMFAELFRDITDRKKAEEELRRSEEKFYKIFNNSPIMTAIIRMKDNKYFDANQRYIDVMGYSREELTGRTPSELGLWDEDEQSIINMLDQLENGFKVVNTEFKAKTKSGRVLILEASSITTVLNNEEYRIVMLDDVTKEKMLEAEVQRLDRLNLIGQMAAGIGHEIRNPLTAVRGFIQMLGDKELYAEDQAYFDLMIEELDRANSIISEYLGMARNKAVDLQLRSLDEMIIALYPIIKSEANLRDMQVKMELGQPAEVLLDQSEIRQLILNMTRNGMDAMQPRGVLTIGTRSDEDGAILYIRDEGCGLSNDIIHTLGTPFITTKDKGTGLGLAVCYSIAARHNARIDYETSPSGTTFYIRFPVHDLI